MFIFCTHIHEVPMIRPLLLSAILVICLGPKLQAQAFLGKTADGWAKQLSTSDDAKLRRSAAFALGKMGSRAVKALPAMKTRYASEKEVKVREALLFAMGEISRDNVSIKVDPDLEGIFVAAIGDGDVYVRRSAAFALGCLASKSDETRTALDKALADDEAIVRQNAAWSLGQFGEAALPSLKKALTDKDSLVKRDAAGSLLQVADSDKVREVMNELLPMCKDGNSEVRRAALNVLVRIVDRTDKSAIPILAEALKDSDIDNRRNAALALSNIGGNDSAVALPVLIDAIKNGDPELRRLAVLAITNIGPAAANAVPDLVAILRGDQDETTRAHAAVALGGIGKAAAAAVPVLVDKVKDTSEARSVRIACAMALQRIGPVDAAVKAVPALLGVLGDPQQDIGVRDRVMFALRVHTGNLRTMKGPKDTFVKIMSEPLTGQNKMLRYDCAYMLGMIWQREAPDQTLDRLTDFLKDDSIKIFIGTTTGIGSGTGEGGTPGKGDVKELAKGDGRVMAVDALKAMGANRYSARPEIMQQLRDLADNAKTDEPLRKKCRELLKAN
jgi:HEAT repeat protein